ncbi:MAG: hypothetical protein ABMA26_17400 [Limisphaerales bacterium]
MSDTADYFQTIGRKMAAQLGEHPDPDAVFANIATEVLREVSAPQIDVLAMADWAAQQRPLPKQVNFNSGFGQPPLVVFEAPGFYIEVLFWFPSRTSIHGHGFTGAFRVLDGYSLQVEYRFQEESAPEAGIRLGKVVARGIEMIAPGKICPILGRDDFIHSVAHMGNPSLTLVARTHGNKELQQFTFLRSGFAHISHQHKQSIARQVDVLEAVFKARPEAFMGRVTDFLAGSDSVTCFKVLSQLQARLTLPVFSRQVLPTIRERFGVSRARVLAALDDVMRTNGLWGMISGFKEPRKQLMLVLGELFPDEEERDALICQSLGVPDAGPVLEEWFQIAEQAFAPRATV